MGKWLHRLTAIDEQHKTAQCAECGFIDVVFKTRWKCGNAQRALRKITYHRAMEKKYPNRPKNCEICGEDGKICWDHDHKTGLFRGWLCNRCNRTLGFVYDNPELLRNLANYLER